MALRTAFGLAIMMAAPAPALYAQDNLPPAVQFDVLRLEIEVAGKNNRHKDVLQIAERMRGIGQPMPTDVAFLEARALHALGALSMARHTLAGWLRTAKRDDAHYEEGVKLFVSIKTAMEEKARAARDSRQLRIAYDAAHAAWTAEKERLRLWKERAVVFGGPGDDTATALTHSTDGGIVLAGALHVRKTQDDKPVNAVLPWITAFNSAGKRLWHRPLGSASDAGSLRSVVTLAGRGYLFGGAQKGFQIAAVTDRLGNLVGNDDGDPWIMAFAPVAAGEGGIARVLKDGTIIALGAENIGKTGEDGKPSARLPVIVRLSPKGKLLGKTVLTRGGAARWYDIKDALVLDNGDIVIAGEARRDDADAASAEGYVLRVTPSGKEIWGHMIPATQGQGLSVTALAQIDGALIAAGREGRSLTYFRLSLDGKLVWRRSLPPKAAVTGSEFCIASDIAKRLSSAEENGAKGRNNAGAPLSDLAAVRAFICRQAPSFTAATAITARPGGFLLLGVSGRDDDALTRITMTGVTNGGNVVWETIHGDGPINVATGALATADGGFVVSGITTNWGRDVLLFKASARGAIEPFTGIGPKMPPQPKPKPATTEPAKEVTAESPKKPEKKTPATDDANAGGVPTPSASSDSEEPAEKEEPPPAKATATPGPTKEKTDAPRDNGANVGITPDAAARAPEKSSEKSSDVMEIDIFKLLGDMFSEPGPQKP